MPSHKQFKYLYGVLLPQICFKMRIYKKNYKKASNEINKAFKEYTQTPNLSKLNATEMEKYLSIIRVWFCVERGWFLHEPNEPEFLEDYSMREFLNLKLYDNGRTISTTDKDIRPKSKIPKGMARCIGFIQQD